MPSVVPVLLKNLKSTTTEIVAMHEQRGANFLGRKTVPKSSVTIQNFVSRIQETEIINLRAFSGVNSTINFYNSK